MKTHTAENKIATYTVEYYEYHIELTVKPKEEYLPLLEDFFLSKFAIFSGEDRSEKLYAYLRKWTQTAGAYLIMKKHEQNMEMYSYYGANMGIPEGSYEYVIDELIEYFKEL